MLLHINGNSSHQNHLSIISYHSLTLFISMIFKRSSNLSRAHLMYSLHCYGEAYLPLFQSADADCRGTRTTAVGATARAHGCTQGVQAGTPRVRPGLYHPQTPGPALDGLCTTGSRQSGSGFGQRTRTLPGALPATEGVIRDE